MNPPRIVQRVFQETFRGLVQALYPPRCLACGRAAGDGSPSGKCGPGPAAGLVCADCAQGIYPVDSPLCPRCGVIFASRVGADHLCQDCMERPRRFFRARAAAVYQASVVSLVRAFKYRGKTRAAAPLGRLLLETFQRWWQPGEIQRIVPVPLHGSRLRRRGFNQAYLMIRRWPGQIRAVRGKPPSWRVVPDALVRCRPTASQAGLDRRSRAANVRGAFAVARPERVSGCRVLLVDDVMTTGETADACARVLAAAGADRVDVLTLARAVGFQL